MIKTIPPLYGEEYCRLNSNPDRGFRLEITFFDIDNLLNAADRHKFIRERIEKGLKVCGPSDIKIAQNYFYLNKYLDCDIPEETLNAFDEVFSVYREMKIKVLHRFAYQMDCGKGGATTERIISHARQLKPLIEKNKDVIYVFQTGFVGAWGEWHSDEPKADRSLIMKILTEEVVPAETYMQLRLPEYKKEFVPKDNPAYDKIGFNDDSFFGTAYTSWYGSAGWDKGSEQWDMSMKEAPYCPQDAELYWSSWNYNEGMFCDGKEAVQALSELRMTSLSALHGYGDTYSEATGSVRDDCTMMQWKDTEIRENWLNLHRIKYAPTWFTDSDGNKIRRNVYEFVRDYLGYMLEARDIEINRAGGRLETKINIVNYGFSAPFNIDGEVLLLDECGNTIASSEINGIKDWHPTNPKNYFDRTLLVHTAEACFDIPDDKPVKIALALRSTNGDMVRLANNVETTEGGYCILA